MDLKGKRVLVVGLGKSGTASALFLKSRGAHVTVSDNKPKQQLADEIPRLLDQGIAVETGGHGERTFQDQDLIVVSPGVPSDASILQQARVRGEVVIGEIELAARFFPGRIIAITGSNGKTTTTALTGTIVAAGGFHTLVGGNIGVPAISLVDAANPETIAVLEVSSFQLETIESYRPHIAVVLNVTPDHLDRHHSFEAYVAAKARIFENQESDDFAVLNADDPTCVQMAKGVASQVFWFSRKAEMDRGACLRNGSIVFRDGSREQQVVPVSEISLKGSHNVENVLAAVCAGMLMGCRPEQIRRRSVRAFKAVEHRLEYVATIRGVDYYNDSKATNVDATIKAIESFPGNIHLILGGKDKDSDYSVLRDLIRERVRRVYTIGAAAEKIKSQIGDAAEVLNSGTTRCCCQPGERECFGGRCGPVGSGLREFRPIQELRASRPTFKECVRALTVH